MLYILKVITIFVFTILIHMKEKHKLILRLISVALVFAPLGTLATILAYQKIELPYYFLIGIIVTWFYLTKLKKPLTLKQILWSTIGPSIWPMLISKYIYDLTFKNFFGL